MKNVKVLLLIVCLLMAFGVSQAGAQTRLVLAELYTNTSCSYCYGANNILDNLLESHPGIFVCVRYHVYWPDDEDPMYLYNTSESRTRTNYYGVASQGVPWLQVDGLIDAGYYTGTYWANIRNRSYVDAIMTIDLTGSVYDSTSRTGTLNMTIAGIDEDTYEWQQLYVRIALTEDSIYYNAPNGLDYHHQTMRDMIPGATGTSIDIANGDTVVLTQDFSIPEALDQNYCNLVVWVQSDYYDSDDEVYQTATVKVTDLISGEVGINDQVTLPANIQLNQNYPNPFNATTSITYQLDKESSVDLAVYDLGGRKVAQLVSENQSAGDHQVIWSGRDQSGKEVATGIYFYSLQTDTQSLTKRMVLLK